MIYLIYLLNMVISIAIWVYQWLQFLTRGNEGCNRQKKFFATDFVHQQQRLNGLRSTCEEPFAWLLIAMLAW